jgi:hypothetical protein
MWKEPIVAHFKVLSQHLPGGTEESHERTQNSRFPGRDLNPGSPKHEAGVLITRPRCSVIQAVGLRQWLEEDIFQGKEHPERETYNSLSFSAEKQCVKKISLLSLIRLHAAMII